MVDGSESKTVAIASSMFFPDIGGTQVFLHNLALSLKRRGHTPIVLPAFSQWLQMQKHSGTLPYDIAPLPPKQYPLTKRSSQFLRVQDRYFSLLQRRYDFDVWQSFGTYPAAVGVGHFTESNDLPHVVRTNGSDIQKDERLGYGVRLDRDIESLIETHATKCDRIIALTESVVQDCRDIGASKEQVTVVPCAVDIDRFRSIDADWNEVREKFDLPTDEFVFLAVGRNHPKKGFKYLVDAADVLRRRTDDPFRIAFVGKGMDPLRKRASELGVRKHISFLGQVEPEASDGTYELPPRDVIRLYKTAGACVYPSLLETFGNVNIEAMAAGTPLISTDAPGSRDIVEHEYNGLVAQAADPESIANQMKRVLMSPELRERLVANGTESVETNYTWEIVVKQYERIYSQITRDGRD